MGQKRGILVFLGDGGFLAGFVVRLGRFCCLPLMLLRRSPAGLGLVVASAHDCGPEPSLRTAPSSSSSEPSAPPSDSLGRIEVARHNKAQPRGLRGSRIGALLGRGLPRGLRGPPLSAARAASSAYVVSDVGGGALRAGVGRAVVGGGDHSGVGWGGGGLAPALEGELWLAGWWRAWLGLDCVVPLCSSGLGGEGLYTLALCFMFKILSILTSASSSSR
ncbi:hypothetical protein LMG3458_05328 [Achromobacter deleyi]|uniref:Uncharacterized protein n=1 Tax=Achromobacter deleyi TaxID=1353891 RepID=A0A6S7AKG9_9BURK|nr:hypothetical protein LMG3458_05328 [Achromobacter deleyi]CAB3918914.1 hypothetical protein LMG3482_05264 [Achromobacter deleyi]CAB3919957.1 hypothetical protein LMG3481_05274 [Achromobacter deleyi]